MAMQNKNFVLAGGAAVVTAPSGCEAFDLVGTAAFNVTYMDFNDGIPVGDKSPAVPFGASSFKFTVYAPRGYAYAPGQKIASISDGGTQTVACEPVRFGN